MRDADTEFDLGLSQVPRAGAAVLSVFGLATPLFQASGHEQKTRNASRSCPVFRSGAARLRLTVCLVVQAGPMLELPLLLDGRG